jgi:hypothetical protein
MENDVKFKQRKSKNQNYKPYAKLWGKFTKLTIKLIGQHYCMY